MSYATKARQLNLQTARAKQLYRQLRGVKKSFTAKRQTAKPKDS